MLKQILGLHHVTSLASGAQQNNDFFTRVLGLRRVKKTVNFDKPELYHLYYGDEVGTPGSVMTYFPNPQAKRRKEGVGEIGVTGFAIPTGTIGFWKDRMASFGVSGLAEIESFGEKRLLFSGPDGDEFALIETEDTRAPWVDHGVNADFAIRGFHSASMRLGDEGATSELLCFMGYEEMDRDGAHTRFHVPGGNAANVIDIETLPSSNNATQGAGSVHHIAFAVEDREKQLEVRKALLDTGYQVTPVIDRNYFWAIYFRTPGGVLFEIATNEPGFDADEDMAHLGQALRLPPQHEPRRAELVEKHLEPITD